jgi:tRNA-dihydrouridine synthase B
LGWEKDTDCLEFVKVLEDAGASLISIHGRTKEQGYSGTANWDRVGEARKNTSLPLFVNGDITSPELAKQALARSGADGMLIGRAALGNPWIFKHIENGLRGEQVELPTIFERIRIVRKHVAMHLARYGERGMPLFRKHLAYYFKKELKNEFPQLDWTDIRSALVRVNTLEELEEILKKREMSA